MNFKFIFFAIILTSITACGPSQKEILVREAEQKAHDDSIKHVAKEEMKYKLEQKFAISDSIKRIETEVLKLKQAIFDAKAEYEIRNERLASIKEFQLLRSRNRKESEIRDQVKVLYNLENLKSELANKLVNLQVRLDFFNSEIRNYSDN